MAASSSVEGDAAPGMYAVARVGGLCIGLPSASVKQALPMPADLHVLPRREGALAGVFSFEGRMVPVVEISRWVETGAAPCDTVAEERVLVLGHGDRLLGLRVDALLGVRRLKAAELRRVHHDDRPQELFQSVAAGRAAEPMLSLVEVGRLMRLADIWCQDGGIEPATRAAVERNPFLETSPSSTRQAFATFRVGEATFGVCATDIGELMPTPALQQVLPRQNGMCGVFRWRERLVPAADLTRVLGGTPDAGAAAAPWICVVRQGELCIGLLVHEVRELVRVDTAAFAPELDDPDDGVLLGVAVTGKDRTLQLVNTARLSTQFPEMQISQPREVDGQPTGARALDNAAYMVFDAGAPFASPIDAVKEVIGLPAPLAERLAAGLAATLEWRGHAVPVVDLERVLAHARPAAPRQLVVVEQGGQRAAVPIDGVRALIAARTASRSRLSAGGRTPFEMITVETPGQQASYAVLDLEQCLLSVRRPEGAAIVG